MGGEIGLPHFEWKVNCFLESCFQPDEDHTEKKKQPCPPMGAEPRRTIAVCFSEPDGR